MPFVTPSADPQNSKFYPRIFKLGSLIKEARLLKEKAAELNLPPSFVLGTSSVRSGG